MKIWRKWRKAAQAGMRPHLEDLSSIGYLFYQPKVPPEVRWCLTLSLFSKRQAPAAVAGSWTHCLCNPEAEGKGRVGYSPTASCLLNCFIKYTDPKLRSVGNSLDQFWGLWDDSASWEEVVMKEVEARIHDSHHELSPHPQKYQCSTGSYTCLQELGHKEPSFFLHSDS